MCLYCQWQKVKVGNVNDPSHYLSKDHKPRSSLKSHDSIYHIRIESSFVIFSTSDSILENFTIIHMNRHALCCRRKLRGWIMTWSADDTAWQNIFAFDDTLGISELLSLPLGFVVSDFPLSCCRTWHFTARPAKKCVWLHKKKKKNLPLCDKHWWMLNKHTFSTSSQHQTRQLVQYK